jgi:leader peptidase (prepilin peptidase)/N-methyltransferase
MHLVPGLVCALLGLAISPLLARVVADPPLWEPSDDHGVDLRGRPLQVVTALLTAGLFGLTGARIGAEPALAALLVLMAGLVVMTLVDVTVWRIPDRVVLPTYLLGLVLIFVAALDADETDAVLWALGCSVACYVFLKLPRLLLGRGAMGGGDIKMGALLGLYLGWVGYAPDQAIDAIRLTLFGLLLGMVAGVVLGLPAVVRNGWRTHYPYGPALALATVIGVLWPEVLLPT